MMNISRYIKLFLKKNINKYNIFVSNTISLYRINVYSQKIYSTVSNIIYNIIYKLLYCRVADFKPDVLKCIPNILIIMYNNIVCSLLYNQGKIFLYKKNAYFLFYLKNNNNNMVNNLYEKVVKQKKKYIIKY